MKMSCPRCQRRYELPETLKGKFFRCLCSALLTLPSSETQPLHMPRTAAPTSELTIPEVQKNLDIPEGWVFPNFTTLLDLSRYTTEEPEACDDLPSLDELPSLDDVLDFDDDLIEGSEDIENTLAEESALFSEEEGFTDEQKRALRNVQVEEESSIDPRLKPALEEFATSEDPQFIVDVLYYCLETKDQAIRPYVEKHLKSPNPIAAYLADRILADLDYLLSEAHKKRPLMPYPREGILKTVFHEGEDARVALLQKVSTEGGFGATPYFILQLLTEKDASAKSRILPALGLIASKCEAPIFGQFLDEPGPRVRLAAVEGLACIGGDAAMPWMIKGMVDKDMQVVASIKKSVKNADALELAQHIYEYLLHHKTTEKKGYISILSELKNSNAFRALVWMFEEQDIRNYALESAKTFELADELKADIILEYLSLSYSEDSFHTNVLEFMEMMDPTFSRARIAPVNQFDDSYVSMIRDSPLFARDFEEKEGEGNKDILGTPIQIQPYGLFHHFNASLRNFKQAAKFFPLYAKTPKVMLAILTQSALLGFCGLLILSSWLKGFGSGSPSPSFSLFPSSFRTSIGAIALQNTEFLSLYLPLISAGMIALLLALPIGGTLAFSQIRSGKHQIRFLPLFPLFASPVLLGHWLKTLNLMSGYKFHFLLYTLTLGLCLVSLASVIFLRWLALIPKDWVRAVHSLGAEKDEALVEASKGLLIPASGTYLTIGSFFVITSLALGYTGKADLDPGAWLWERMSYSEGWLMLGSLGSLATLGLCVGLGLIFSIFPAAALIPNRRFEATQWRDSVEHGLTYIGLSFKPLFASVYSKKKAKPPKASKPKKEKKGRAKKNKKEADAEKPQEEAA